MIDLKIAPTSKLLWVDLEMTGFDPIKDCILEVAVIITDFDLNEIATYEAKVLHDRDLLKKLFKTNPWWASKPKQCDIFLNGLNSAKPSDQVEEELVNLIREYFDKEPVIMAGNSIRFDRPFFEKQWTKVEKLLHYRMVDVTTFKIIMQTKFGLEFKKKNTHRALEDIKESIAELKYYLDYFNRVKDGP